MNSLEKLLDKLNVIILLTEEAGEKDKHSLMQKVLEDEIEAIENYQLE